MAILNEGVPVFIDWRLMKPGASFFIPAIQTTQLARSVRKEATARGMKLTHRIVFENGYLGVRFWRLR